MSLYDTGSDVTLMHNKIFEQIRECVIGTIDPAPPGLSQACGAPVKDVFSCQMNLFEILSCFSTDNTGLYYIK